MSRRLFNKAAENLLHKTKSDSRSEVIAAAQALSYDADKLPIGIYTRPNGGIARLNKLSSGNLSLRATEQSAA